MLMATLPSTSRIIVKNGSALPFMFENAVYFKLSNHSLLLYTLAMITSNFSDRNEQIRGSRHSRQDKALFKQRRINSRINFTDK